MPQQRDITAVEIVWRNPWVRAAVYVIGIAGVITLLILLRNEYAFALQVAIIGFVIAYILHPLVTLMGRIRIGRVLAVIIIYLVLLQVFVLGSLLVSQVVTQLGAFISSIPAALDNISGLIDSVSLWLSGIIDNLPGFLADRLGVETGGDLSNNVQEQLETLLGSAAQTLRDALNYFVTEGPSVLFTTTTTILSTTFQVFLILLTSAYFLYDFPKFVASFRRLVPLRWRSIYVDLTSKADVAVGGYLRGQLVITTCVGVFIYIGLKLIGVPLAEAISFLAAIFNLVPYLGPIIGVIPAVLLGFTVSPLTALLAVVVFIVANQLEGNILSPLILSKSTNLHPVTVLLAILIGAGLLGLVGALLAVPIVAFTKVILEDYLLQRPAYTGHDSVREKVLWEKNAPRTAATTTVIREGDGVEDETEETRSQGSSKKE